MELQDTDFYKNPLIHFGTKKLDLSRPAVMGILNITPDSFYDGGRYKNEEGLISQVEKMLEEGADIIDIGAASTRPGAEIVSSDVEISRLIAPLKLIRKKFPGIIISIDTYSSEVAKLSVESGADMINDVSGGTLDNKMFETVGRLDVPYVLMHIKGTPLNMQKDPHYADVISEVKQYFQLKIMAAREAGIRQIFIDPGFGFGKTTEHNYLLLKELESLRSFGFPLLAGVSRKGMINKVINTKPEAALNGTTVVNALALLNGTDILRVHDVKEAKEAITIINYYQSLKQKS